MSGSENLMSVRKSELTGKLNKNFHQRIFDNAADFTKTSIINQISTT